MRGCLQQKAQKRGLRIKKSDCVGSGTAGVADEATGECSGPLEVISEGMGDVIGSSTGGKYAAMASSELSVLA